MCTCRLPQIRVRSLPANREGCLQNGRSNGFQGLANGDLMGTRSRSSGVAISAHSRTKASARISAKRDKTKRNKTCFSIFGINRATFAASHRLRKPGSEKRSDLYSCMPSWVARSDPRRLHKLSVESLPVRDRDFPSGKLGGMVSPSKRQAPAPSEGDSQPRSPPHTDADGNQRTPNSPRYVFTACAPRVPLMHHCVGG